MNEKEKKIWYELYDLAYELDELNIYNILSDTNYLCFIDKDLKHLYYLSILGKTSHFKAMFFMDENQINNFRKISDNDFSSIQVLNYQEGYLLSLMNYDDLEEEEKKIFEALGLKQKKVLSFRKYQKGYMPYFINIDDAKHLIYLMNNFKPSLLHVKDENIIAEDNKIITRFYDQNIDKYKTSNIEAFYPEEVFIDLKYDNKKELLDLKKSSDILEIDFNNYLPVTINAFNENNKIRLPLYFSICDTIKNKIIKFDSINELDYNSKLDYYRHVASEMINYFKENRIPKLILVRDEYTKALLKDLDLNVEVGNLKITDNFIKMIIEKK